jgi:hypothetical protein
VKLLKIITCLICFLAFFFHVRPAAANTDYKVSNPYTKISDGGFQELSNTLTIEGITTTTFIGNSQVDRAEFRLPSGFYFDSAAISDSGENLPSVGVVVYAEQGFEGLTSDVLTITPISYSTSKPDCFRGFEIAVKKASVGEIPHIRVNLNSIYVPKGSSGYVTLTVESSGNSAFTEDSFYIANVTGKGLELKAERTPSLTTGSNTVGPILVTEKIEESFDWIELTLPNGFTWSPGTVVLNPGLGLSRNDDGDEEYERDYEYTFDEDRYGQSVLRVALTDDSEKSSAEGTLRIECDVEVDEDKASPGNVTVVVDGNEDPSVSSLTIGTFSLQEYTISAKTAPTLYGGLRSQEIADITITELVPGTLLKGRSVTLSLPSWAKWDGDVTVQVEGVTELSTSSDNGPVEPTGKDNNQIKFSITQASVNDPGKITIKDAEVNLQVDAPQGDLKIAVSGSAGISAEVAVGNTKTSVNIEALSKPALTLGTREQKAGDIEIRESAGRILLANDLYVEFPDSVILQETPQVEVVNGNLDIGNAHLETESYRQRLVIPINTASSSAGTIRLSNILYDVNNLAADGDVTIRVGGPAVNEVNEGDDPLFPSNEWAGSVVNAVIGETTETTPGTTPDTTPDTTPGTTPDTTPDTPPVTTPETRNILFFIGDGTYRVNGDVLMMDVAPYIDADRTFIPLRFTGTALGIPSENIFWDSEKQTALLIFKGTTLRVPLGENAIYKNETKVAIDVAPQLYNDRIMLPIRAIATAFGATVDWDAPNRMVKIVL